MTGLAAFVPAGLEPLTALGLVATSFVTSFITISLGIGGGVLLLAIMASLLPPLALIPVHGAIQLGSNVFRAFVLRAHIDRAPLLGFALGALAGVALGGAIVVELPPAYVQIGVGAFVIFSVLAKPPAWLGRWPWLAGGISSFLTMFFGATGPFVATFTKTLYSERQVFVATNAVLMTLQHLLKVLAFSVLGFAFAPWALFLAAMIGAGLLGTLTGRHVLVRMSNQGFKRALDVVLILISLRLIWNGAMVLQG